jgi:hypothetical protein
MAVMGFTELRIGYGGSLLLLWEGFARLFGLHVLSHESFE